MWNTRCVSIMFFFYMRYQDSLRKVYGNGSSSNKLPLMCIDICIQNVFSNASPVMVRVVFGVMLISWGCCVSSSSLVDYKHRDNGHARVTINWRRGACKSDPSSTFLLLFGGKAICLTAK